MTKRGPVIGVLGGSGGVGASTFAAVLAAVAGAVLVDLVPSGGGIDVLLGIEGEPGARWSGLRLAGGRLAAEELTAGLPRAGPCPVLAADCEPPGDDAIRQVVHAAAQAGPVVLDLPRESGVAGAALGLCDLAVLVARADVAGLVAAHAGAAVLEGVPCGLVVRRGHVPAADAARLVGIGLVGELESTGRDGGTLDLRRPPRGAVRVARGVLAALTGVRRGAA